MEGSRAVRLEGRGGVDRLVDVTLPVLAPGPGEVRIRVEASLVGATDVIMRTGYYPYAPPFPFVPGYVVVGRVEAAGDGVPIAVGTRVAALAVHRGYAERATLDADEVVPIDAGLDAGEVVAVVLNYVTAYQAIHRAARLERGGSALVLGAAGGVGSALVELCREAGVVAYGAASPSKHARVRAAGGIPLDGRSGAVDRELRALRPEGVDAAFDPLGGEFTGMCVRATRRGGRVVAYGYARTVKPNGGFRRARVSPRDGGAVIGAPLTGRRPTFFGVTTLYRRDRAPFREDSAVLLGMLADGRIPARGGGAHRARRDPRRAPEAAGGSGERVRGPGAGTAIEAPDDCPRPGLRPSAESMSAPSPEPVPTAVLAAALVDAFENGEGVLLPDGAGAVFVRAATACRACTSPPTGPRSSGSSTGPSGRPGRCRPPTGARCCSCPTTRATKPGASTGRTRHWSVVALTTGEPANLDPPFVPRDLPQTMFYAGRSFDDPATTIREAATEIPGPARAVYEDDGAGFLHDVSADGSRGLFVRFLTMSESELRLVDLGKGTSRRLFPTTGSAAVFDAAFSSDGERIYVATDGGGEQALLLALDRQGREVARYVEADPATARIQDLLVTGGAVALSLDAGNRSEVRLLDEETLLPRVAVGLPVGTGRPTAFSADGARLLVEWSTADAPSDVWVVDTATGALALLTSRAAPDARRPAADPEQRRHDPRVRRDADPHQRPPPDRPGAGAGDRPVPRGPAGAAAVDWSPIARFFLARGYGWVEPNIRGRPGSAGRPGRRRRRLASRLVPGPRVGGGVGRGAALDRRPAVAYGNSYGGYLVLIALTRQPEWDAVFDLYGLADLETFMASMSGLVRQNYRTSSEIEKDAEFLRSISPYPAGRRHPEPAVRATPARTTRGSRLRSPTRLSRRCGPARAG